MTEFQSEMLPAESTIQARIITVCGVQVMLDRDLAELYGVETRVLNQAVKRNIKRFLADFMLQLTDDDCSRSQIVILNGSRGSNTKYKPYAFTENGVAMLSSVLRSEVAIAVNIEIMRAFTTMRKFMLANAQFFQRIETVERKQLMTDVKVDRILERLDASEQPVQGVFYDGQLWDACLFAEKLIAKAKNTILLINGWVDSGTLDMLAKKTSECRN